MKNRCLISRYTADNFLHNSYFTPIWNVTSYTSDVNFYEISDERKRRLINQKRVLSNEAVLSELPETAIPVRVLEAPLEELILDCLESGTWTIAELAHEFDIADEPIRRIINMLRRKGEGGYVKSSPTREILDTRKGVIRAHSMDGNACRYTLESIPFHARIVDPTLMIGLLNIHEEANDFKYVTEDIPAGNATDIDEDFAVLIGDFWSIEPAEAFDYLTGFDRWYVQTRLGPLPIVLDAEKNAQVQDRFLECEGARKRYRHNRDKVERIQEEFESRVRQNSDGLVFYQELAIRFFDILNSVDDVALEVYTESVLEDVLQEFLTPIEEEDEEPAPEISLEDEIMPLLQEQYRHPSEIHDELPPVVQKSYSVHEVKATLDRLTGLGIISKRGNDDSARYSSKTGTVDPELGLDR